MQLVTPLVVENIGFFKVTAKENHRREQKIWRQFGDNSQGILCKSSFAWSSPARGSDLQPPPQTRLGQLLAGLEAPREGLSLTWRSAGFPRIALVVLSPLTDFLEQKSWRWGGSRHLCSDHFALCTLQPCLHLVPFTSCLGLQGSIAAWQPTNFSLVLGNRVRGSAKVPSHTQSMGFPTPNRSGGQQP